MTDDDLLTREIIQYFRGELSPAQMDALDQKAMEDDEIAHRMTVARDVVRQDALLAASSLATLDPGVVEEIDREERAAWWKERFKEVGRNIDGFWQGAAAAVEVVLRTAEGVATVTAEAAALCLAPGVEQDFALGGAPAFKGEAKGGSLQGGRIEAGIASSRMSGAVVAIAQDERRVEVTFLEAPGPACVVLIPWEPGAPWLRAAVQSSPVGPVAEFQGVPDGDFLLAIPER
jgi:hypothetical protein